MKENCALPTTAPELYDLIARALDLPKSVIGLTLVFEDRRIARVAVTYNAMGQLRPFHQSALKAEDQDAAALPV